MAIIMDGKALAVNMQEQLQEKVARLKEKEWTVPGLVVIMVGENPASQVYVRNKERAAKKAGFHSKTVNLSESISEEELIEVIEKYNQDPLFQGFWSIALQTYLMKAVSFWLLILKKDVDGFHPMNTGNLWNGHPQMVPCTPAGIMEILREYNVELEGKTAVIIGRSNIVGKPMAQLLLEKNATVTLTHSRTPHLAKVCNKADVLIVAIGRAKFVTEEFVKEGAVVIDVGINRDEEGKLCGDVDFDQVKEKVSMITPVPGGVGPMTITMLMEQTYQAALRSLKG